MKIIFVILIIFLNFTLVNAKENPYKFLKKALGETKPMERKYLNQSNGKSHYLKLK